MIEETSRQSISDFESLENEAQMMEADQLLENPNCLKPENEQATTPKVNYFFVELLVCSLALWSFLFVAQSPYGNQVTKQLQALLNQEIPNDTVQMFITQLEETIKQLL